jgi:hypothetical protein
MAVKPIILYQTIHAVLALIGGCQKRSMGMGMGMGKGIDFRSYGGRHQRVCQEINQPSSDW